MPDRTWRARTYNITCPANQLTTIVVTPCPAPLVQGTQQPSGLMNGDKLMIRTGTAFIPQAGCREIWPSMNKVKQNAQGVWEFDGNIGYYGLTHFATGQNMYERCEWPYDPRVAYPALQQPWETPDLLLGDGVGLYLGLMVYPVDGPVIATSSLIEGEKLLASKVDAGYFGSA